MAKREREAKRGVFSNALINGAVQYGLDYIAQRNPGFKGREEYIKEHIDYDKLKIGIDRINGAIEKNGRGWSKEERTKFAFENLARYVASGGLFDDDAKGAVLEGSLEEKTSSGRKISGRKEGYDEDKDLERVTGAFRQMYNQMVQGGYSQDDPKLQYAIQTVANLGFYDQAIKILYKRGLIDEKGYKDMKSRIKMVAKKKGQEVVGRIYERTGESEIEEKTHSASHHVSATRVAAIFFGVLGIMLIGAAGTRITGNIVGVSGVDNYFGLLGMVFSLIAAMFIVYNRGK